MAILTISHARNDALTIVVSHPTTHPSSVLAMYGIRWLASCNCGVRHELVDLLEVGRVEGTQGEEMDSI